MAQASLYDAACVFLCGTASLSDYISDRTHGYPGLMLEELSGWAGHEALSLGYGSGDIEATDPILIDWGERIIAQAAALDKLVDPQTRLYYLIIRWELRIIEEFDRLVRGIDSEEVQRRYRAGHDLFAQETAWLRGELASLEQREDIAGDRTGAFHAAVDTFVTQLAAEWNQEVERLSQEPWYQEVAQDREK